METHSPRPGGVSTTDEPREKSTPFQSGPQRNFGPVTPPDDGHVFFKPRRDELDALDELLARVRMPHRDRSPFWTTMQWLQRARRNSRVQIDLELYSAMRLTIGTVPARHRDSKAGVTFYHLTQRIINAIEGVSE